MSSVCIKGGGGELEEGLGEGGIQPNKKTTRKMEPMNRVDQIIVPPHCTKTFFQTIYSTCRNVVAGFKLRNLKKHICVKKIMS